MIGWRELRSRTKEKIELTKTAALLGASFVTLAINPDLGALLVRIWVQRWVAANADEWFEKYPSGMNRLQKMIESSEGASFAGSSSSSALVSVLRDAAVTNQRRHASAARSDVSVLAKEFEAFAETLTDEQIDEAVAGAERIMADKDLGPQVQVISEELADEIEAALDQNPALTEEQRQKRRNFIVALISFLIFLAAFEGSTLAMPGIAEEVGEFEQHFEVAVWASGAILLGLNKRTAK
jgi:hypothetical protein